MLLSRFSVAKGFLINFDWPDGPGGAFYNLGFCFAPELPHVDGVPHLAFWMRLPQRRERATRLIRNERGGLERCSGRAADRGTKR